MDFLNFNSSISEISIKTVFKFLVNLKDVQDHRYGYDDCVYIYILKDELKQKRKILYFSNIDCDTHIEWTRDDLIKVGNFRYLSLKCESQMLEIAKKLNAEIHKISEKNQKEPVGSKRNELEPVGTEKEQ
jgi:hypothetical protein